ncbi:MAG: hypothetical protein ACK55I_28135, partial [bacterium]
GRSPGKPRLWLRRSIGRRRDDRSCRVAVGAEEFDAAGAALPAGAHGDRIDSGGVLDFDPSTAAPHDPPDVHEHRAVGAGHDEFPADQLLRLDDLGGERIDPFRRQGRGADREADGQKEQRVDGPAFATVHARRFLDDGSLNRRAAAAAGPRAGGSVAPARTRPASRPWPR